MLNEFIFSAVSERARGHVTSVSTTWTRVHHNNVIHVNKSQISCETGVRCVTLTQPLEGGDGNSHGLKTITLMSPAELISCGQSAAAKSQNMCKQLLHQTESKHPQTHIKTWSEPHPVFCSAADEQQGAQTIRSLLRLVDYHNYSETIGFPSYKSQRFLGIVLYPRL